MKWTPERCLAAYAEVAIACGHTPRTADLGTKLVSNMFRNGLTLARAEKHFGLAPNQHKGAVSPLPDGFRPVPAPEPPKTNVAITPQPAYALSPDELARERAASMERQRKARETEPEHRPLLVSPRERSRRFRVRSARDEIEEDRRAMLDELWMRRAG